MIFLRSACSITDVTRSRFFRARSSNRESRTAVTNHTFRATGITAYLKNGGTLEHAKVMATHASTRTTQLYDRRSEEVRLDEVERIVI